MNNDLISRSALFKAWDALDETQEPNLLVDAMIKATQDAPTIEAEPVRHGRWRVCLGGKVIECTVCTGTFFNENGNELPNYCPDCGAKMDAEVEGWN